MYGTDENIIKHVRNSMKKNIVIVLCLVLFVSNLSAQVYGELRGYVTDQTGTPLIGATVSLKGMNKGAITDENGFYTLQQIVPGSYNLEASYIGYEPQAIFNVIVKSKGTLSYNFVLKELAESLAGVTVTQNVFRKPKETPLSIQKLTAVEIATYPGGNNDVVTVAQSLPGVSPSIGGFRNDLIIRGGAPNETVYYLDGVEIPNINHFSTQGSSGGPVGLLNVSFIEDVTLSTSAFGAQYDNPLSGVLQFKQREGNNRRFNGNFRLSATEVGLTLEGPLFKNGNETSKTSFIISARRSYLQFLFKLIGLPIRPDYYDYQYKITHKIDEFNELNLIGVGSIDDFSVEEPDTFDEDQQAALEQVPFIEQETNAIGVSWKRRFKDGTGYIQTAISNNTLKNTFTQFADNVNQTGVIFSNDSRESESKIRFQYTKFLGKWKFISGFNVQYSEYSNETANVTEASSFVSDIDFVKYGYFANTTTSFFKDKLSLSVGFRIDDDSFTNENSLFLNFSPRFSASYEFADNWKLNATAGRYFKIPPYTILGFRNNDGALVNQNARYTRSDHYVLGLEHIFGSSSSISVEGFFKDYRNFPVSVQDQVSLANQGGGFEVLGSEDVSTVGNGRTYGAELFFQQKLSNNFYGIFSYTYFFSQFTGFDLNDFIPSVWDSRHLVSFTGGYKLKRNWEISSRYRFAGRTPFVPVDIEATTLNYPDFILDFSRLGEEKLDTFSQLDIRIDKKWNAKRFSIDLYLEVQNILAQSAPEEPQFGLLRDENNEVVDPISLIELEKDKGRFIPVIGLVIDF